MPGASGLCPPEIRRKKPPDGLDRARAARSLSLYFPEIMRNAGAWIPGVRMAAVTR